MSWFTIHAVDVKPVVTQLSRIADLFETYLRVAYDYHVTPPKPLTSDTSEPDSVSYASDAELAKQEMLDEVKHFEAAVAEAEKEEN